jgi:flagellin-like protein
MRRLLRNLRQGEPGITGLETAIILIAFVVAAAVFAYTVLSAGGSKYKILGNLGLTAAVSGICLLVLPMVAGTLFVSVSQM